MKAKHALAVLALFLCASPVSAEQDFYGIRMKSDLWAWNLVLHTGPRADDAELAQGPVIDHQIYAEALVRRTAERTEFMLSVVNNSDEPIATDYDSRDFLLYLHNGKVVPLIDPESQSEIYKVPAKKSAEFTPSLGNLRVRPEEIRMIEASFDLGRTRIFLFPASLKKEINALKNPDRLVVAGAPEKGKKPANLWEWMSGKPKSSNVPTADPSGASTRDRVDRAIHDFKYKPAPVERPKTGPASSAITRKEEAIDLGLVESRPGAATVSVRTAAQVIEVNRQYNYIVANLGLRDGLERDSLINVVRNGRLVARAKVRQLRPDVAAALVLPEYARVEIRPGDLVNIG